MARETRNDAQQSDGESIGDEPIIIGNQLTIDIPDEGGAGGAGSGDPGTGAAGRTGRRRRTRAQVEESQSGPSPAQVASSTKKYLIQGFKLLQRKFNARVPKLLDDGTVAMDREGRMVTVGIWELDPDEANILANAIDNVRSKLVTNIPERMVLPAAIAWCAGVSVVIVGMRISAYQAIKAQAIAQNAQQSRQNEAQRAYSQNGAAPVPVTPDGIPLADDYGNPPEGWDSALRGL